jgi:Pyruvate/2-oxoacid:ferredoxin oxidoreductase gamma subunit
MGRELTIGIGGAAGDGLDNSRDTLAKGVSGMGLYIYAYNSYQSIIRGGHIWLRVRIGQEKVYSHGDHLNLLIALNQDTVESHAREVGRGGAVLYNSDRFTCESLLLRDGVATYADGVVHTNTLESFWSPLKRGIHGTSVSVEPCENESRNL